MNNKTEYKNCHCCQHRGSVADDQYCFRTEKPTQIDDLDSSCEHYKMCAEIAILELSKWCDNKRKKIC